VSLDRAVLDELTQSALRSLSRHDSPAPSVVRLLLRGYFDTGREEVADALGPALAQGLELAGTADDLESQARWLDVFIDAAALSEDDRLRAAADDLIAAQRRLWAARRDARLASLMRSLEACLRAAGERTPDSSSRACIQAAIDELEHAVGRAYRPGDGIADGNLGDQIAAGLALIVAYRVSGRLPYAMLAEELLQFSRRTCWSEAEGLFRGEPATRFVVNCEAARLLSRLADLHGDDDYRKSAVTAVDADYERDVERVLSALTLKRQSEDLATAAAFGVVLHDFLARELR
jgi:uncharacterized protein YyaL (SSP411 family)